MVSRFLGKTTPISFVLRREKKWSTIIGIDLEERGDVLKKVVLGLSGGVDSALCARLLLEKGCEVTGVYLDTGGSGAEEARQAALELGIPFLAVSVERLLEEKVIAPFVEGYRQGITPIPCIFCNPAVKFHVLWQKAQELGASLVATGHYAITRKLENGIAGLYMSPSPNDQSYMLYRLPQEILQHVFFPLGELDSKEETRLLAYKAGLSAADKPDSMEICFILEGDHAAFMEKRGQGLPPGDFVDEHGTVLGRHKGIHHYTLGQRRGLGIAAEGRLFVREIRAEQNQVVLSLTPPTAQVITVGSLCATAPEYGAEPFWADVKIRHSRRVDKALVTYLPENRAKVEFSAPVRAPSPGQSAVFYQDGRVIGGGYIEKQKPL